uniref:Uncharacterized protein n=1 Tax=Cacopsylla melanoneura TaxID=428564 RepID=A0A8D8TNR5_9HEMI
MGSVGLSSPCLLVGYHPAFILRQTDFASPLGETIRNREHVLVHVWNIHQPVHIPEYELVDFEQEGIDESFCGYILGVLHHHHGSIYRVNHCFHYTPSVS